MVSKPILRAVLVVAVSIAVGTSCGSSGSKTGESLGAAAGTIPAAPASAPGSSLPSLANDASLAAKTIVQARDLPTGWTMVEDSELVGTELNHPADACDPDGLFTHHTAGRGRHWSYLLQNDGTESGNLYSYVKVAKTPGLVTKQLALFTTEAHHACEADRIRSDLIRARATVTGPTTWSPLPKTLPVPGGAERYVTPYTFLGVPKVMYTDIIWLGLGRTRVVISPQACCTVPSNALEDSLIALTGTRLKAANKG